MIGLQRFTTQLLGFLSSKDKTVSYRGRRAARLNQIGNHVKRTTKAGGELQDSQVPEM